MVRSKFSRWFIAVASGFGARVLPAAGAAANCGRRVLLTRSWRELGIGVVFAVSAPGAYGGRDVQIAAAEFGLRRH